MTQAGSERVSWCSAAPEPTVHSLPGRGLGVRLASDEAAVAQRGDATDNERQGRASKARPGLVTKFLRVLESSVSAQPCGELEGAVSPPAQDDQVDPEHCAQQLKTIANLGDR